MEKTFIEDLWEKNPELVRSKVASICSYRDDATQYYRLLKHTKEGLVFRASFMHNCHDILVSDFGIKYITSTDLDSKDKTINWIKFMYSVYDKKYAYQFISHRNQQLDRFMEQYEEKYNNQTLKMLDEMGFDVDNNHKR